jgi:hypothetical protein
MRGEHRTDTAPPVDVRADDDVVAADPLEHRDLRAARQALHGSAEVFSG